MSDSSSRTLFIVVGVVGGLFVFGMIAASAVLIGAGFLFFDATAVPPPPAVRARAPINVEADPVDQPDERPVVAPVPIKSQYN